MSRIEEILSKSDFSKIDIVRLLLLEGEDKRLLVQKAREAADQSVGRKVYFRGLIEYSNICMKNCYYCGIRKDNRLQQRYTMKDEEVLECARFAFENNYGSIVLQTGERIDAQFTGKIENLLREIKKLSSGKLGITLSLGEQSLETYQRWFDAGAHRYLLRIETSNKKLYKRYHPRDGHHNYEKRLETLQLIRKAGFQLGTGVMIGLPGQSVEDLADDLLFIKHLDVDMVGMGPYVEHENTPMYSGSDIVLTKMDRYERALNMLAVLRLMMPMINIAATTAMQAIHPQGREQAILAGANIVMPNLTPLKYRECYLLYDGKPCLDEDAFASTEHITNKVLSTGNEVGFGEWGDSIHFLNKKTDHSR